VASEREALGQVQAKVEARPTIAKDKAARRLARKSTSIQETISDLFQDRFLFVTRQLTRSKRKRLLSITRGLLIYGNCARSWSTSTRCLTGVAAVDRDGQTEEAASLGQTVHMDWQDLTKGLLAEP